MGRDDVARRSRASRGAVWGPVLLVLVVLAGAFGSFQYDVPRRLGWGDRASAPDLLAPPSGVTLPEFVAPAAVAAPLVATVPDPESIRTVLAPTLRDKDLGSHVVAAVADPRGQVLFRGGTSPASTSAVPASTMKLLTAAAALESLGPATTFRTTVVQGAAGEIVLVGGGDPYLTDNPLTHDDSDRPAPADLRTLARATATALVKQGTTRVKLGFDDSLFGGPGVNPDWDPTDIPAGYAAPITALWSDQGHPADGDVVTVKDPSQDAAQVFARALRAAGVQVAGTPRRTPAAAGAAEIAGVDSARVDQLVSEVLASSDNEGAEVLAHLVGVKEGFGGSFAGGLEGVTAVLGRLGVTLTAQDSVLDGSGLAPASRLTADTLLKVLALGVDPARPELRTLVTALPVAGFTGSLAERFEDGPVAGRGRAAAKTGTLTGVHALAGVATTPDGSTLLFVLMADKVKPEKALDAREALDVVVSTLASCLCS